MFDRAGRLFVTLGDRFRRATTMRRTLGNHLGKVVRIEHRRPRAPTDNPFVGRAGARPEIWSYGHRNVQGAALHPATGELWTHEHGPQGGDELNVTEAGKNYGWPVITYGREYGTGTKIGEGTAQAPAWSSRSPTGCPRSRRAAWPSSRRPLSRLAGQLFVGALRAQVLIRLELDGRKVVREERLLQNARSERIRDVRPGPRRLALPADRQRADGRILRLERYELEPPAPACRRLQPAGGHAALHVALCGHSRYNAPGILNADLHCHSTVSDGTLEPGGRWRRAPRPTASSCGH